MLRKIITSIFICFCLSSNSQNHPVKVFSDSRFEFKYPWAGGMNSCQFGKTDLDLDGVKDLVVFDRIGDRIMPFLVVNSAGSYDYRYAPEYAGKFPSLSHWVIFVDYNLDGKVDLFTYSPGYAGMIVYKNTSVTELEFRVEVFPYLKSFQGGGYVNILVTYADYPAITDLDNDGDLDILTFYGLGSFVEKHKNQSMEKYGHADSLDFERTEYCWGYFAESEESNDLTLDTCLRCGEAWRHGGMAGSKITWNLEPGTWNKETRHTGSTFCIMDLNADALPDLLLGDVDYPNLVALYNGGNIDTAHMTSFDWQYPPGDQAVNLYSMPAAFYDDFDFDGIKDLLVSPFDPSPFNPENFRSNWLYHNYGSNQGPQFSLHTSSFLQKDMLDFGAGAYPVFFDADQDGLQDLVVGNYGYYDSSYLDQNLILHTIHKGHLAWLRNSGTITQPAFTLVDRDFANISLLNLVGVMPAFGDLDGDGDADMLLGYENGQLIFFENIAATGSTADFTLKEWNYLSVDVGSFSTPQLFDLNKDNLPDLVIGEKGGNLNYYQNTGSLQNPVFSFITDSLSKINVTDYNVSLDGFSVPHFYRGGSGNTHLLVGSEQGRVFYFTDIDDNLTGKFTLSDTLAGLIGLQEIREDFGYRTSAALRDLDQDGYPELIAGNFSGGLNYSGKNSPSPVNRVNSGHFSDLPEVTVYPNPANDRITVQCHDPGRYNSIEIFMIDHTGHVVIHLVQPFNENIIIETGTFSRGMYLLKISMLNNYLPASPPVLFKVILM